jgi:hypothetical protein
MNFEGKKQTKYFFVQNLYYYYILLVINIKIFKYSKVIIQIIHSLRNPKILNIKYMQSLNTTN